MLRKTALILAVMIGLAGAGAAGASENDRDDDGVRSATPQSVLSVREVAEKLAEKGYPNIREIELEDGIYEVEASDESGKKVEFYVNPVTAEITDMKDSD